MAEELHKNKVVRGVKENGKPMILRIDPKQQKTLNEAHKRVTKKNWDYVAIVSGLSGAGKSTLAQTMARFLCPWFNKKYIAFTDEEFIDITNRAKEFSAVVLDESFQSLNTRVSMSSEFLRIVNHLQIIRQKHLFIILCLPNYFDLSKGVSIFRSSHLFVVYADEEGDRGRFLAFDRDTKRKLYVLGSKFMDYNAVKSNYYGKFWKNDVVEEAEYEKMKREHLESQNVDATIVNTKKTRDLLIYNLKELKNFKTKDIIELSGLKESTINNIIRGIRSRKQSKLGS